MTHKLGWLACAALIIAYLLLFTRLDGLPLQDAPNHLARAVVMADLMFHHGARFGEVFEYRLLPLPYMLGDLIVIGAVEIFGPATAAVLWNALTFLSLPAALLFYLHVHNVRANTRLLVLALSLYLATDWFFLMGFAEFRLGLAIMIVALALVDLIRRRPSVALFAVYWAVLAIGYLVHLAMVIFLIPALGVSALLRLRGHTTTLKREIALFIPIIVILVWQFSINGTLQQPDDLVGDPLIWRSIENKLLYLTLINWQLTRFGGHLASVLMLLFGICLVCMAAPQLRARLAAQPMAIEMIAIALAYLAMYFVLPSAYSQGSWIDVRALAFVSLFAVLACVYLREANGKLVVLAILIAALNLVYVGHYLLNYNAWANQYRQVVAAVPSRAYVLPIYTLARKRTVRPFLHTHAFLVIDRDAISPLLFSGDRAAPMKYFRYKHPPYTPLEGWYNRKDPVDVNWRAIACTYDFVLITKPYDPRRIQLRTQVAAENASAALLKNVAKGESCAGRAN
jgi:hypothetical protein